MTNERDELQSRMFELERIQNDLKSSLELKSTQYNESQNKNQELEHKLAAVINIIK